MKIVIAGADGFVGRNLVDYMAGKYTRDEIIGLDLPGRGYRGEDPGASEGMANYRGVKGSIEDRELMIRLFMEERPDTVINAAFVGSPDQEAGGALSMIHGNVAGASVLLEACFRSGVGHFHQVSCGCVYGSLPADWKKSGFTEEASPRPMEPYGVTRASADLFVLACARAYGVPVTISRVSRLYGPYQGMEGLIPVAVRGAVSGHGIRVKGCGEDIHNWLHVSDACRAIDLIINEGQDGAVYNASGHKGYTNREAAGMVWDVLERPLSSLRFLPVHSSAGVYYSMNTSKIKEELGWVPSFDFHTGIRQTVRWYLNHDSCLAHRR